jgi:hypothetical protein
MSASGVLGGGVADNLSFAAAAAPLPPAPCAAPGCGLVSDAMSALRTAGARKCAKQRRSHGLRRRQCHVDSVVCKVTRVVALH